MNEQNLEYLVTVANAINGLDGWELEVFNDSFRGFIKNPTKENKDVVSSNLSELVEKLTTITEAGEKVEDEKELEETLKLLKNYIATSKYGYGYSDILNEIKKAYDAVIEYFKSRGFVPIKEEKSELSTTEDSFKIGRTPPSHEELIEHAGKAVDALLQDAKNLGFDVYEKKEETFDELLDRRLREALQKIKERQEFEKKHRGQPFYGSRGPQWWIDSQIARHKLSDRELHELADDSREREEKASKRAVDKILSDYQRSKGE